MPVYRKGKKWRVVIFFAGKRHDWVVEGLKCDAEAFEARERGKLEASNGQSDVRVVPTLSDFTGEGGPYLAHSQLVLKASTRRNRGYQIASLVEHLGHLRLNQIDAVAVEGYQHARTQAGIRPSTINDDVKVLVAVMNYAKTRGVPLEVPKFKGLSVRGKLRRHAESWSREEITALLATCADEAPRLLPILVFLLNTGCRKGEAMSLEWENVDLKRREVRIWASEEWQPKDADNREVPINDQLLPWLERAAAEPNRGRWVFTVGQGKRKGQRFAFWPQKTFDAVREAAGLTGGPHKLRHTYATHFLEACPDLFLLGRVMGHSHAHVTELYGHLLPEGLARAARAVSFASPVGPAELEARKRWGAKTLPATLPSDISPRNAKGATSSATP